jgi:hypothetical protein
MRFLQSLEPRLDRREPLVDRLGDALETERRLQQLLVRLAFTRRQDFQRRDVAKLTRLLHVLPPWEHQRLPADLAADLPIGLRDAAGETGGLAHCPCSHSAKPGD